MTTRKKNSSAMKFIDEVVGCDLTVGSLVESHRLCEGYSQAELARRLGVSRSYVNAVEKGRRKVSPEQAARFAREFDMLEQHWVCVSIQEHLDAASLPYTVALEAAP